MAAVESVLSAADLSELLHEVKKRSAPLGYTAVPQLMLLGPPGCGKGTLSEWLRGDEIGLAHLSTGDMLRAAVAAQTDVGQQVKAIIDGGHLVSDDIVLAMVKERLIELRADGSSYRGFVLDGFPRTEAQAVGLDNLLAEMGTQLGGVFQLKIDDALLERRICGRRVHPPSGRTYHIEFKPPKEEGKDDVTGEPLIQRQDDSAETLRNRMEAYRKTTAPLVEFYKKKGILFTINASQKSPLVRADLESLLLIGRALRSVSACSTHSATATPSSTTTTTSTH